MEFDADEDAEESDLFAPLCEPAFTPAVDLFTRYRFLFLPTFDRPTSIMVTQADIPTLRFRQLEGQAGFAHRVGPLVCDEERCLSAGELLRVELLVEQSRFWEMPSESTEEDMCLDGAGWTFEAIKNGRYHSVYRCCVDTREGDKFGNLCRGLFSLTVSPRPWWSWWRRRRTVLDGYG